MDIRSILDVKAEVKDVCIELSASIAKETAPEETYEQLIKTIGKDDTSNFREHFKQQIITMIKQVSFKKNERFHKVFWQNNKLIIMSIELGIRSEKDKQDQIILDMVNCYAEADFSREWFFTKWKTQRCEELVATSFNKLQAANRERRV